LVSKSLILPLQFTGALRPGLLESAYQFCMAYELRKRGLFVETEVAQNGIKRMVYNL